jgi:hypothetical protein
MADSQTLSSMWCFFSTRLRRQSVSQPICAKRW